MVALTLRFTQCFRGWSLVPVPDLVFRLPRQPHRLRDHNAISLLTCPLISDLYL